MAIKPVVRYMILCDDWEFAPADSGRVCVYGLTSNIHSIDEPPYPLLVEEVCVFLALTDGYGKGEAKIQCVFEETGARAFATRGQMMSFNNDPLEIAAVSFRIRNCPFPRAGLYTVQFWFNNELIDERPLRLR